jgi:hypothetical protein
LTGVGDLRWNRQRSANQIACALISMMARSTRSNQKPDTLMQDRYLPDRRKPLATGGRTIHWVKSGGHDTFAGCLLIP